MPRIELDVQQLPFGVEALINQAGRCGEIVLTRHGQPVAKIVPVISQADLKPRVPKFGSARSRVTVPDTFDEPLDDFRPYMELEPS